MYCSERRKEKVLLHLCPDKKLRANPMLLVIFDHFLDFLFDLSFLSLKAVEDVPKR
jgi:hypothetical protein